MNKFLLILLMAVSAAFSGFADNNESAEKRKELQDFKMKYFIQEAEIPADKQQEFIRLYNQYDQNRENLFKDMGAKFKAMRGKNSPTDADYIGTAEAMASFKSREGDLEKNFFQQLRTLLTPKQLYMLKKAEHKFQRKVMEMQNNNTSKTKTKTTQRNNKKKK